jgi:hypothetical protein
LAKIELFEISSFEVPFGVKFKPLAEPASLFS